MPRSLEVSKRAHLRTLAKAMLSCAKHAIEVKVGGSPRKRHRRLLARLKVGGLLASLNGHTRVELNETYIKDLISELHRVR